MSVGSELAAREAQIGILPVLPEERIWGFGDFTWVNIGLAIATWAFRISARSANVTMLLAVTGLAGVAAREPCPRLELLAHRKTYSSPCATSTSLAGINSSKSAQLMFL